MANVLRLLLLNIGVLSASLPSPQSANSMRNPVKEHVCSLFFYVDPYLWRQVNVLEQSNVTATRLRLKRLMSEMVTEANAIYSLAEFYGDGHKIHKGVKFQLSHYIIDESPCDFHPRDPFGKVVDCQEPNIPMSDLCQEPILCKHNMTYNVFCNDIRTMRFYLHLFSAQDHAPFCLSYALTYRQMNDFQGVAWIKGYDSRMTQSTTNFGYCAQNDAHCMTPFYFRNTGVVNMKMASEVFHEGGAKNVFVHEIGHSLGAKHDDEIDKGCSKYGRKDDLHFLMTSDVLKIIEGNTSKTLSTCAMRDIGKNLDRMTCWQTRSGSDDYRESQPHHEPNCEYFARRTERSNCLRLERAKNGLVNIIWTVAFVSVLLGLGIVLLRLHATFSCLEVLVHRVQRENINHDMRNEVSVMNFGIGNYWKMSDATLNAI
ncbi:hypothetical protein TCAL_16786 [Tigriopus californicus]|uniref:Peptidase M12B domain-containing protein n=2 Tax=Tigriopus californicus TaxID=6832 RepID=A0A553PRU7_TIGCA|nr:hypothetical protein TCAL_16786 [Tigriopus californicus]